jgi:type 1 glutamine amidotransferase
MKTIPNSITLAVALVMLLCSVAVAESPAKIVIIVGPTNHPPGTHEVAAGARVMQYCIENSSNLQDMEAEVFYEWPKDVAVLDAANVVVFIGDTFPPNRFSDSEAKLRKLGEVMEGGCGIVCVHYATGLRAEDVAADGEHPLLHWMGGYFATRCEHHQSIAKIFESATINIAATGHAICRGCDEFTLHDEPYIKNYFGKHSNKLATNVTAIATSMLPPEDPKEETVAWCIERPDGGRGFGIVMPHFYRNWAIEDLRRLIMNGIVWSAHLPVPSDGVQTTLPNLLKFKPEALEPIPRKKQTQSRTK